MSNNNKKKSTKKVNKKKKEDLPGIAVYIRELYKEKWFPSIDDDGEVYVTTGVGKAAISNKKLLKGSSLERHIKNHFPQGHIHYTNAPEIRASAHKSTTQSCINALLTTGTNEEAPWSLEAMELAVREFEVPAGTELLFVMPELFHWSILKQHIKYQCGAKNNGVKTHCLFCNTNKFVKYDSYTGKRLMFVKSSIKKRR